MLKYDVEYNDCVKAFTETIIDTLDVDKDAVRDLCFSDDNNLSIFGGILFTCLGVSIYDAIKKVGAKK